LEAGNEEGEYEEGEDAEGRIMRRRTRMMRGSRKAAEGTK